MKAFYLISIQTIYTYIIVSNFFYQPLNFQTPWREVVEEQNQDWAQTGLSTGGHFQSGILMISVSRNTFYLVRQTKCPQSLVNIFYSYLHTEKETHCLCINCNVCSIYFYNRESKFLLLEYICNAKTWVESVHQWVCDFPPYIHCPVKALL